MTRSDAIIEMGGWLQTPPGRYLLAWEQDRVDQGVADAFGFHALQLGLPELQGLRANRMPHRWVASDVLPAPSVRPAAVVTEDSDTSPPAADPVRLHCEFDALPFAAASLDLVLMPHALELARDPHLTLREVERVLMPEGRLLITGFNPASLWALRQRVGPLRRDGQPVLPRAGEFIGYWRLRDWLRLLGFEVEAGRFGCYRPPCGSDRWLQRFGWMDALGDRWWPVLGASYYLCAVKRVRGMRLVGLARHERRLSRAATAVVATQRREPADLEA